MEDWYEVASIVGISLAITCAVVIVVSSIIYAILRLARAVPKFRGRHTWKTDLRIVYRFATVLFPLIFFPILFLGCFFSDFCGTSFITEVPSPDKKHKIVVYNFDCGATTSFSLDVSLLRLNQQLPKYRTASLLYDNDRQCPTPYGPDKNFEVQWQDPSHVTVRISGLNNTAKTKHQDGVAVAFENLP